jgi:mRNA degradation ribonuclease J1/J2
VAKATTRVVIGIFASNVQRLIALGKVAQRTGRKVLLLGGAWSGTCARPRPWGGSSGRAI